MANKIEHNRATTITRVMQSNFCQPYNQERRYGTVNWINRLPSSQERKHIDHISHRRLEVYSDVKDMHSSHDIKGINILMMKLQAFHLHSSEPVADTAERKATPPRPIPGPFYRTASWKISRTPKRFDQLHSKHPNRTNWDYLGEYFQIY